MASTLSALTTAPVMGDALVTNIQGVSTPLYVGVNPSTDLVYVSDHVQSGTVTVINGATNAVATTIDVGSWPTGVAVDPTTNLVYVGNMESNSVSVIDGSTNTVVGTIGNVENPYGLAINAKTDTVYAVEDPNALAVIDAATDSIIATVPLPSNQGSFSVAVDPVTNMVYATSVGYSCAQQCGPVGFVDVINGTSNTEVGTMTVSTSGGDIAVDPQTDTVYTTNGGVVSVIDGATDTVTATISAGGGGVAVNPSTDKVYSTSYCCNSDSLSVIDGATNAVLATITTATDSGPYLAVDSNTDTVYAANELGGTVSVVNGGSGHSSTTYALTVDSQAASGAALSGFPTTLSQNGGAIASGSTPSTFTLNGGQSYVVAVGNHGHYAFSHWLDTGSSDSARTISITQNTTITAVFVPVQDPTRTSVTCRAGLLRAVTCTSTVTDTAANPLAPTGTVDFTGSSITGSSSVASCTLRGVSSSTATCTVKFSPVAVGSFSVKASYVGDTFHLPSSGSDTLACAVVSCL